MHIYSIVKKEWKVRKKIREMSIFDFSTLCTNLPHQDLIRVLHKLDKFSFNRGCKDYQGYRRYLRVIWTNYVCTKKKRRFNGQLPLPLLIMNVI